VIELRLLLDRRVGNAVRAGKKNIEMIEAAVLGIDHDDRFDLFKPLLAVR